MPSVIRLCTSLNCSTSHQFNPSQSHVAQHILVLVISAFILYAASFHLHICLISWGLVSDTIFIEFIFSLLCNLFWCTTSNHCEAEIATVNIAVMMLSGISFLLFTEVLIPFAHGGNTTHLGNKKKGV